MAHPPRTRTTAGLPRRAGTLGLAAALMLAGPPVPVGLPVLAAPVSGPARPEPARSRVRTYNVAIFEQPTTTNVIAALGPEASAWNFVVLLPYFGSLYGLSPRRYNWIPGLAADFPGPFREEAVDGRRYLTARIPLRQDIRWADGTPFTADDVVFTYNELNAFDANRLGGNWPSALNPQGVFHRVEKLDDFTVKFYLNDADPDAPGLQPPGLAQWQFGLLTATLLQASRWRPIVERARRSQDPVRALLETRIQQPESLSGLRFARHEPGAFWESTAYDHPGRGEVFALYANGAVYMYNPNTGYEWTGYGRPEGPIELQLSGGPFVDGVIYRVYQNQNAAVLALIAGEVHYIHNPTGLQRGFRQQLERARGVTLVENPSNGFRYLGFNLRRRPMDVREFRQAVATLIDRELVARTILQGVAIPLAGFVPPENRYWAHPNPKAWGQGLTRSQRVAEAVRLLKQAGFRWQREPQVDLRADRIQPGSGLLFPDGTPVPELELLAPSAGYDPLRATFALWIERWLKEAGIPVRANLTNFNVIQSRVFEQQDFDMWILGWGLGGIFPEFLHAFFHSSQSGPNGFNAGGYRNPEYDAVAERFMRATEVEEARPLAFRLQEILAEDVPYVVLFESPLLEAYRGVEYPYTELLDGLQGALGMPGSVQLVE